MLTLKLCRLARDSFKRVPLGNRHPVSPFVTELFHSQSLALLLSRLGPKFRLAVRIGDALFCRELLNQVGTTRESLQQIGLDSRDLEVIPLSFDAEPDVMESVREANTKRRLKIWRVPLEFTELARLPALLLCVPRRIEREHMRVQLRIGHTLDRPGCGVNELRPNHVARGAVIVLPALADSRLHFQFNLTHRFLNSLAECVHNCLIRCHRVEQ